MELKMDFLQKFEKKNEKSLKKVKNSLKRIKKEGKAFPSAALRCVLPLLTGAAAPVTPPP
jgi:hypothetical protein